MAALASRDVPATAAETSPERPWPVRLLTAKLTEYVAKAPALWVEGQVMQVTRRPGQPTCYLTLRDTDVDLSFQVTVHARVLEGLAVPLAEGAHVVLHARAQLWPRRGSLSLAADAIRPVGAGELLARLELLRRQLAAEGLFGAERKRPLPFLPRQIGLICGRASAAEQDVVQNAQRRWPAVRFEIAQVAVQGATAVSEVIDALEALDAMPAVDVIVVARGGGSLEDLLPFSNEALVRAVAGCRTPVVSAIGHEADAPLLDLVADVRASTPTDAGRRVVPDVRAELDGVAAARQRARAAVTVRIERERRAAREARERARAALAARLARAGDDIGHLRERVRALSPAATLARGYAVVQGPDGTVLRDPAQAPARTRLRIRLARGELAATALARRPSRPAPHEVARDGPTNEPAPSVQPSEPGQRRPAWRGRA
jgi:exodeoxyribonuclease VII large subunit